MALSVGDTVPDFTLPSTAGRDFTLSTHAAGKPLIIYFYPKDFTPLCTAEACSFRDTFDALKELGVDVVGISTDDVATHLRFKEMHNLPFELLADTESLVAKSYGSVIPFVGATRRKTFLVDSSSKLAAVYENNFSADEHTRAMVAKLKAG
jgi:thioredoxin-dependent peroxiredoxin